MIPEKQKDETFKKNVKLIKQAEISPTSRMIAAKVESFRTTLGITQEDLAKRIGMSRVNLVNIEQGRQNLTLVNVEKLCKALNITPKHMMKGIWF